MYRLIVSGLDRSLFRVYRTHGEATHGYWMLMHLHRCTVERLTADGCWEPFKPHLAGRFV